MNNEEVKTSTEDIMKNMNREQRRRYKKYLKKLNKAKKNDSK